MLKCFSLPFIARTSTLKCLTFTIHLPSLRLLKTRIKSILTKIFWFLNSFISFVLRIFKSTLILPKFSNPAQSTLSTPKIASLNETKWRWTSWRTLIMLLLKTTVFYISLPILETISIGILPEIAKTIRTSTTYTSIKFSLSTVRSWTFTSTSKSTTFRTSTSKLRSITW